MGKGGIARELSLEVETQDPWGSLVRSKQRCSGIVDKEEDSY